MRDARRCAPGGAISVNIRGISTTSGDAQPLYVIDGVPVGSDGFSKMTSLAERSQVHDADDGQSAVTSRLPHRTSSQIGHPQGCVGDSDLRQPRVVNGVVLVT